MPILNSCPICNTKHRNRKSVEPCITLARNLYGYAAIANEDPNNEIIKESKDKYDSVKQYVTERWGY